MLRAAAVQHLLDLELSMILTPVWFSGQEVSTLSEVDIQRTRGRIGPETFAPRVLC